MELLPVEGMPEVGLGDDIAAQVMDRFALLPGDIVVLAQKVVSKAEGRVLHLAAVSAGAEATGLASMLGTDPRLVQVILDESVRVVRAERVLIVETRQGYVCANAGVDHSNVPGEDAVSLLPEDPDASAGRVRARIRARTGLDVGVIVADTFGRAWRMGIANVALGVAGLPALLDLRGGLDDQGKELTATVIAVADELASAAELVMGKTGRVPAVVVRGYSIAGAHGTGRELVRPADLDLFR